MKNKKQIIGIAIFIILIIVIIAIKMISGLNKDGRAFNNDNLTTVYVATGGGKEDFIADEDVIKIMREKYGLNVVYDNWSNGKLIKNELVREDRIYKI